MSSRKAIWSVSCSALVLWVACADAARAQAVATAEPADAAHAQASGSADPAGAAHAQAVTTADPAGADIVVTAQRREQSIQDVPIAISAIGKATLEARGIVSVVDLQGVVPGLNISGSSGANGSNMVSIRGIAAQPVVLGTSQPTAVYLDGVYVPRPDATIFGLEDVERIEVLRGPQGTLYGRNATAGAINIITQAPTDQFQARLNASYGNFNSVTLGGYVMGGLGGNLSASVSGSYDQRDGYYTNTQTNDRVGGEDFWTIRGRLRYHNGGVDISLIGDDSKRHYQDLWRRDDVNGNLQLAPNLVSFDLPESDVGTTIKSRGIALTADFDLTNHLRLTSISSLRSYSTLTSYDINGTLGGTIHPYALLDLDTLSQELRLSYTNGPLRLIAGGNYYREDGNLWFRVNPAQFTETFLKSNATPYTTSLVKAWAAFAQVEFDLLPSLTLVAGARYNDESRDFTINYSAAGAFPQVNGRISDSQVLPSFGINFHPSTNLLIYAKASAGYQSGGFAYAPGPGAPANTFGPEHLWAYEAGVRSTLLGGRLTLNATGFYYDYKDIQVRQLVSPGVTAIANAGAASVKGFETEINFRPLHGLTLTAQATYARATIDRFCEAISANTIQGNDPLCVGTPSPAADRSGNALAQAPRFSGGLSATYSVPIDDRRRLTLSATYAWESNVYYTAANLPSISSGGWHTLSARAELELSHNLSIYVYGRNLTNERYITNAFYLGGAFPGSVQLNDPRRYGAGFVVRY